MKSLRQLLFGHPDGRALMHKGRTERDVRNLRDVLRTVRENEGLIILNQPLARNDLTATRYGGKRSQYLSLDGAGKPYALFTEALSHKGTSVPVGTEWNHGQRRLFIPFDAQLTGALLWWYDTHKFVREEKGKLEERLRDDVRKLPLDAVKNEAVNGAAYQVVVPNRQAGKNAYHMTLYGIPVVDESAAQVWRRLRWEQKTTHAQNLDAAQSGEEQHAITAEAIAALYKIAFVENLNGNSVPRGALPLLRPTKPLLKLDASLRRVRVKKEYGVRTLRGNERSRLFGAALRQAWKAFYVFHASSKIAAIPREEMERVYSSSGL